MSYFINIIFRISEIYNVGEGGGGKRRHLWEPSDPLFHPNPSTHLPSSQEELLF